MALIMHTPTGKMLDRYLPYHQSYHAVMDIETEGCNELDGSPVLSIGVHVVGPTDLGIQPFYAKIDVRDSYELGFKPEQSTLDWIMKLPEAVRDDMYTDPSQVRDVLHALSEWFGQVTVHPEVKMLYTVGNSFKFDHQMVQHYYRKLDMKCPWVHWQERDFRTLAGLGMITYQQREGIKSTLKGKVGDGFHEHHALFDAMYEGEVWWATVLKVQDLKDLETAVMASYAAQEVK